jgi:hypothetical protein
VEKWRKIWIRERKGGNGPNHDGGILDKVDNRKSWKDAQWNNLPI